MIREEIQEIRRLIAKAENLICSTSRNEEFCQQARLLRRIVHDTPDPHNVEFGVHKLEELIQQMKEKRIDGWERLNEEFISFKKHSNVLQNLQPQERYLDGLLPFLETNVKELFLTAENVVNDDRVVQRANDILHELHSYWEIGPHFMPLRHDAIDTPYGISLERAFSGWYDFAYNHARECVESLVGYGLNRNPRSIQSGRPDQKDVEAFRTLQAACQIALKKKDEWASPLIRCSIVAAQELRGRGSTGLHGVERLRAKLIVGRLIGILSQYDLDSALELAELTIESVPFSRSQILYEQEDNQAALGILIEQWSRDEYEHPLRLDIVAQARIFLEQFSEAKRDLLSSKTILLTAQSRCYSSKRGEYYEKRYTEILEDIYLGRLTRTLSSIDAREAFRWCDEISAPIITLGCYLQVLLRGELDSGLVRNMLDKVNKFAKEHDLISENLSLAVYEMDKLPHIQFYPDFPAERWGDLTRNTPTAFEATTKAIMQKHRLL